MCMQSQSLPWQSTRLRLQSAKYSDSSVCGLKCRSFASSSLPRPLRTRSSSSSWASVVHPVSLLIHRVVRDDCVCVQVQARSPAAPTNGPTKAGRAERDARTQGSAKTRESDKKRVWTRVRKMTGKHALLPTRTRTRKAREPEICILMCIRMRARPAAAAAAVPSRLFAHFNYPSPSCALEARLCVCDFMHKRREQVDKAVGLAVGKNGNTGCKCNTQRRESRKKLKTKTGSSERHGHETA